MTETTQDRLDRLPARTGRHIQEGGSIVNTADALFNLDAVNVEKAVHQGRVFKVTWRGTIPEGSAGIMHMTIPPNFVMRGLLGDFTMSEGSISYLFAVNDDTIGNILAPVEIINVDARKILTHQFPGSINLVDSASGGINYAQDFVNVSTQGSQARSASITTAAIGGLYDENSQPTFRLTNTGSKDVDVAITLIFEDVTEYASSFE